MSEDGRGRQLNAALPCHASEHHGRDGVSAETEKVVVQPNACGGEPENASDERPDPGFHLALRCTSGSTGVRAVLMNASRESRPACVRSRRLSALPVLVSGTEAMGMKAMGIMCGGSELRSSRPARIACVLKASYGALKSESPVVGRPPASSSAPSLMPPETNARSITPPPAASVTTSATTAWADRKAR